MEKRYATWKSGYKAVKAHNSALRSLIYSGMDEERLVDYALRRTTRPRRGCGPLCIFRTIRQAKRWAYLWTGTVYECLYKPSKHDRIWSTLCPKELGAPLINLPSGTILADRVRLIKRV